MSRRCELYGHNEKGPRIAGAFGLEFEVSASARNEEGKAEPPDADEMQTANFFVGHRITSP